MAHENNAGLMIKPAPRSTRRSRSPSTSRAAHPGTLIVVQGDHETGGLTIENPDTGDESGEALSKEDGPFTVKGTNLKVFADWTTGGHTGADTPITASGPGSERFDGMIDNTDVHDAIKRGHALISRRCARAGRRWSPTRSRCTVASGSGPARRERAPASSCSRPRMRRAPRTVGTQDAHVRAWAAFGPADGGDAPLPSAPNAASRGIGGEAADEGRGGERRARARDARRAGTVAARGCPCSRRRARRHAARR